jgi:hypothetical protein
MGESLKVQTCHLRRDKRDLPETVRQAINGFSFVITLDIPINFLPWVLYRNFISYYTVLKGLIEDYLSILLFLTFFFLNSSIFKPSLRLYLYALFLLYFIFDPLIPLLFLLLCISASCCCRLLNVYCLPGD